MKICSICKNLLDESLFHKNKISKDGLDSRCKNCKRQIQIDNIDKHRESSRKYRNNNPEVDKEYWNKNKDKINEYRRSEEYKSKNKIRQNNRYKTDPVYRLNKCMHSNVSGCITSKGLRKRNRKWEELVGYTKKDLMQHIESKLKEGMTWNNYGEWHIDHIKPKSWFRYSSTDDKEFKECWALSNLQPLWANENKSKGNRYSG